MEPHVLHVGKCARHSDMYYICVQDRVDTDKWCYMCKFHTWDKASEAIHEYIVVQGTTCRVEWTMTPPKYTRMESVY